jgi:hypothetical protein
LGEELGEQTRVSAGNPFGHSDSAVKLSVLAGRLEKPFRLFICRHWHCDSKNFIEERISFADLARRGHSSLARGKYWAFFLELDASSFSLLRVVSHGGDMHLPKSLPLAGRDLHQIIPVDHH